MPPGGYAGAPPLMQDGYAPALPAYLPQPGWRSITGMVVPPPAAPELRPADEHGFAVSVQWPAVLQAAAYVVELREAGSAAIERFVRSAPEAKLGTLVELRVGGLRPGPSPGRVYVAQVRTIGADGSESSPSAPGWSPPLPSCNSTTGATSAAGVTSTSATSTGGTLSADAPAWLPSYSSPEHSSQTAAPSALTMTPPPAAPPPSQPPPAGAGMSNWAPPPWLGQADPGGATLGSLGDLSLGSPSGVAGSPPPEAAPWGAPGGPPPPPAGPPPTVQPGQRREDPAPEATGQEDCLILD